MPDYSYIQQNSKGAAQSLDTCTCPDHVHCWAGSTPRSEKPSEPIFQCWLTLPLHAGQSWAFQPPSAAVTVCLRVVPALSRQVSTPSTEHDDSRTWTFTVCGREGWSHIFASLDACQPALATALDLLASQRDSDRSTVTRLWCFWSFLNLPLTLQHGQGRALPHKLRHLHSDVSWISPIKPDTNFSVLVAECPLTSRGLEFFPKADENAMIPTGQSLIHCR